MSFLPSNAGHYMSLLAWERPRIPQEELESVAEEGDVWVPLLLPPRLDLGLAEDKEWMEIFVFPARSL